MITSNGALILLVPVLIAQRRTERLLAVVTAEA